MSDEEHSDSEFYYPEDEQEEYDTNFHQFLSNEEQPSELFEQQNTENSQKEINNFLKQQRSKNTLSKTSSDMKAFSRYLQTTNKQYLNLLNLLLLLALSRKKKRTNCLNANSLACLDQKSFRGPCGGFWHSTLASEPETKAVNYAGAIFNSKKTAMVVKCLYGYAIEARKHVMVKRMVEWSPTFLSAEDLRYRFRKMSCKIL